MLHCKSSIAGKGIVRGRACRGSTGLAHVACPGAAGGGVGTARWHERGVCEMAEVLRLWSRGPRRRDDRTRLDVLEDVRGPARDGRDAVRSMDVLGTALSANRFAEAAMPVLKASVVLRRRHWSHEELNILRCQGNLLRPASKRLGSITKRSFSGAGSATKKWWP